MAKSRLDPQSLIVHIPDQIKDGAAYPNSIGVGDQIDPKAVVELAMNYKLQQIVQFSNHDQEMELRTSELMLERPHMFIDFPLSSILDPENVSEKREKELRIASLEFSQSSEKKSVLNEIETLALDLSKSSAIAMDLCLAADELFTNAVFNAPYVTFDQNGHGASRTAEESRVAKLRPGVMFLGRNDSRIVLGCTDGYGTLNPDTLLNRLRVCLTEGARQSMKETPEGGAGLGTYLLYRTASSFYVGVRKGSVTIVCCSFSLDRRAKVRASLPKNLHVCSESESSTNEGAE